MTTSIKKAIILAGGKGTRLRSAVPNLPKPMAPINNVPFLEYLISYWIGQGIKEFFLSVGYKKDIIISHFGREYKGSQISYVLEDEALGTGGAFILSSKNIKETFLLLNGDTFVEIDLQKLANHHKKNNSIWTIAVVKKDDIKRYLGIKTSDSGEILELASKSAKGENFVNAGAYLINGEIRTLFRDMIGKACSLENDLLPLIHSSDCRVYSFEVNGKFIDIGLPEDYYRAQDLFKRLI